jgi:hypothetical protein
MANFQFFNGKSQFGGQTTGKYAICAMIKPQ